ncbi:MAG: hypothetical protein AAFY63_10715 [Cyanobacteria bacterium J06643_13]
MPFSSVQNLSLNTISILGELSPKPQSRALHAAKAFVCALRRTAHPRQRPEGTLPR